MRRREFISQKIRREKLNTLLENASYTILPDNYNLHNALLGQTGDTFWLKTPNPAVQHFTERIRGISMEEYLSGLKTIATILDIHYAPTIIIQRQRGFDLIQPHFPDIGEVKLDWRLVRTFLKEIISYEQKIFNETPYSLDIIGKPQNTNSLTQQLLLALALEKPHSRISAITSIVGNIRFLPTPNQATPFTWVNIDPLAFYRKGIIPTTLASAYSMYQRKILNTIVTSLPQNKVFY